MEQCIRLSEIVYNDQTSVNTIFSKIYNENYYSRSSKLGYCNRENGFEQFDEETDTILENIPSLLSGIMIEPLLNDDGSEITELIDINTSEFLLKHIVQNEGAKILDILKKIININSRNISKEVKILLVSKLKFSNTQADAFKKFILNYCKILVHNKYILIQKLKKIIKISIELIGGCDWNNYESMRNKYIEDSLRTTKKLLKSVLPGKSKIITNKNLDDKIFCFEEYLKGNNIFSTSGKNFLANMINNNWSDITFHDIDSLISFINNPISFNSDEVKSLCSKHIRDIKGGTTGTRGRKADSKIKSSLFNRIDFTNWFPRSKGYDKLTEIITNEKNNIINYYNYLKYNFISKFEVAKTAEVTKLDPWWLRTPSIVAYSVLATTTEVTAINYQYSESVPDWKTATDTFNSFSSNGKVNEHNLNLFLAQVMHISMGPIIGVFVGAIVGSILESKWFKNLRTTREQNLRFQDFITNYEKKEGKINEKIISLTKKEKTYDSKCLYTSDTYSYLLRFYLVKCLRELYEKICYNYYDKHIENIDIFLFLFEVNFNISLSPNSIPNRLLNPEKASLKIFTAPRELKLQPKGGYKKIKNKTRAVTKIKQKNKNKTKKAKIKQK
jgi:hypothetical protein